jgi:hypothetical protein
MSASHSNGGDPLAPLDLPAAIRAQGRKLVLAISSATTLMDTLRAADLAQGFVLGLETVRALNPDEIEGLYRVFDRAYQVRQAELST